MQKILHLGLGSCHIKRAIQMLVAATIAIFIYKELHINYGYWIALSAIITIQATTGASIKRARDRLLGTVMGVLIGVALINILPTHHNLLLILVPVLIFLAIYLFSSSYTYSIFFVSILLIILMANGATSPWQFAFARILDTAIGLSIGIAACYLLWPNASQDELQQNLYQTVCACEKYFKVMTQNYLNPQNNFILEEKKVSLEAALLNSINSFKTFSYEPGIMKVTAEAVYAFIININTICSSLEAINLASQTPCLQKLTEQEKIIIEQFNAQISLGFKQIESNFGAQGKSQLFNFDHFQTDITLIDEQKIKSMLNERKQNGLSLILFIYELKKIAFELKYMNQAVEQITIKSFN